MNRRNFLLLSAISPVIAKDYVDIKSDKYLTVNDFNDLTLLNNRLTRLRRFVGFANFNTISLDNALYYARNYSKIGEFSRGEINLIEKILFDDPSKFGFFGKKTVSNVTKKIQKRDIQKISKSGHYIYKGKPLEDYYRIIKDVDSDLILTSGVRSVIKQLSLYTSKLKSLNGNLTQTSRIIAPPTYTYHAISDFDIGKKGWGNRNFTNDFAKTEEFAKMIKLDYISIRYTKNNKDGVRFEPWHVKVI